MMNGFTKIVISFFVLSFISFQLLATCSPFTVPMTAGTTNAAAFTTDGQIGVDGAATYFLHWDNTYLYVGWTGGRTNYSSDLYYVGIDIDPGDGNGTASAIEGMNFDIPTMDYYAVYENNASFYGAPASNGNGFELYENSGGAWSFVSRTGGDDGTSSQVDFQDGGGEVRLRIAWTDLGGFTPGAASDIRFIMWTNNANGDFIWSTYPTENATGSTPQVSSDAFTFTSTVAGTCPAAAASNGTLPVDLGRFTAKLKEEEVQIDWTTHSEWNNSHFELERSADLRSWETLIEIEGKGTSFTETAYSFIDERPIQGDNYYRLKQIDFNGGYAYSETLNVEFVQERINFFPNPADDHLNIDLGQIDNCNIELYNLQGQQIHAIKVENQTLFRMNLKDVSTGLYLLRINDEKGVLICSETVLIQ